MILEQQIRRTFSKISRARAIVNRTIGNFLLDIDKKMVKSLNSEIRLDIEYLKRFENLPKHEKEKDFLYKYIEKKYAKNYHPSTLYKFFSFQDQIDYTYLRVEIDSLLKG